MKTPPIHFGIYFVSKKYLKTFNSYINDYSKGLFKDGRPFVCIYPQNNYSEQPYFVPLLSLNQQSDNYKKKRSRWLEYKNLELNCPSFLTTILFFKDPIDKKSNITSIASLSKTIPVPNEMLIPKLKNGKLVHINQKDGNILATNLNKYIQSTIVDYSKSMPLVGYLNILAKKKHDPNAREYAIDHNKLTQAIKEYYKTKQNHKSEEKEK